MKRRVQTTIKSIEQRDTQTIKSIGNMNSPGVWKGKKKYLKTSVVLMILFLYIYMNIYINILNIYNNI